MRVLITGATGLVGQEIVKLCHSRGFNVNYLTTRSSKISNAEHYKGFHWNPQDNTIDPDCFEGVSVIIHLAGASIAKRWTSSYKQEIIDSRVKSTQLLIDTLKTHENSVQQVISASAIGIYPDDLTKLHDQTTSEINSSFLGYVVKQWETAVDGFSALHIKVAKIRIGLVLSDKGGALLEIAKPVKFGVGAAFGSGKHWQSWIHITDLAAMFLYVLEHNLEGIYNGTAPNPVTNKTLVETTAKVLKKPFFLLNIPKFMMRLVLGEMHIILFESQRVSSKRITETGFNFKFNVLHAAIENLMG